MVRQDDKNDPSSSFVLLLFDDFTISDRTSDTTQITDMISRSNTGPRMKNGKIYPIQEWDRNHGGGCSINVLSNCVVTAASCEITELLLLYPPSEDGIDDAEAALAVAVADAAFIMERILPLILAIYPLIPPPTTAPPPPVNHPIQTTNNEQ
jgi:hypothetical protein